MDALLQYPTVRFDDEAHRYFTQDGEPVPGVTEILEVLGDDYAGVPAALLEEARKLGKAVHRTIELDVKKDLDVENLPSALAFYYERWRTFVRQSGFMAQASEQRVYSARYGYAGTLDLLGIFPDTPVDTLELIDAKCCIALPRKAGPQTAAYARALKEQRPYLRNVRRWALVLKGPRWKLELLNNPRDDGDFLAALRVHQYRSHR